MRRSVVAGPLPLSRNRVRKRAEEASTFKGKLSRTKVRRNLMEKERKKNIEEGSCSPRCFASKADGTSKGNEYVSNGLDI